MLQEISLIQKMGTVSACCYIRELRAVVRLVNSALHLIDRQDLGSHKWKSLISQVARSAQGALAARELGGEIIETSRQSERAPLQRLQMTGATLLKVG